MKSNSLEKLRLQIDELDQKIQLLISERADLAAEVAKVKQESNTLLFWAQKALLLKRLH